MDTSSYDFQALRPVFFSKHLYYWQSRLNYTDSSRHSDRTAQMTRLKLPIGIQTFREIREDGCY